MDFALIRHVVAVCVIVLNAKEFVLKMTAEEHRMAQAIQQAGSPKGREVVMVADKYAENVQPV